MPLLAEGKWQRSLAMRVALLTLHEARLGACRQRTMATHAAAASLQRS
ncbi:hypothetical protein XcfCFBP6992P_23690 [Xanthomonas citri pv. phaseoli var. fuscans]|nr:hypothetical protein [Xanthomonas citri]QTF19400.1 hypothetical protein XcfCFBP6992P_23690 [Xanthomonas citri pv. phaseoli var. fuscans]